MKTLRGFRLGHRLTRICKWTIRPRRKPARLHFLARSLPISRLSALARYLRRGAKKLCFGNSGPDHYIRLGHKNPQVDHMEVPKGHLAVYVGEGDGDTRRREVVPVIYFNHPLFGELLKEAERVYGFDHPGGITLPCGYSEFEKVKMRIEKWDCGYRGRSEKHREFLVVS
ncbi:hypothetical protein Tsubulata_013556 [Turnera subulata]|uniref:Uncharacterized protein n=1 Tax=Turnera subulata TaxID=218843 RepID=A0A9Q0GAP6_9ROSI|nr:hypothetical protein Tsubulata_013556 [Turnera subulata]